MEFRHDLTYNNTTTEVTEPNGFNSLSSVLRRDFENGGAFFQFTEGGALEFPDTARQVFKDAINAEGYDAEVTYEVFKRQDQFEDWEKVYNGKAIIEDIEFTQDYAKVEFEDLALLKQISDRLNIPVSLARTTDLDGNAISAATSTQVNIEGRPFLQTSSGEAQQDLSKDLQAFVQTSGDSFIFESERQILFNTFTVSEPEMTATKNEVEWDDTSKGFVEDPFTIAYTYELNAFVVFTGGYLNCKHEGVDYFVDVTTSGQFGARIFSGSPSGTLRAYLFKITADASEEIELVEIDLSTVTAGLPGDPTDNFSISYNEKFLITEDTQFRIVVANEGTSGGSIFLYWQSITLFPVFNQLVGLSGDFNTLKPATDVNCYFLHEALRHNVEVLTGNASALDAPFIGRTSDGYSEDGAAAYFVELNGYLARGFAREVFGNLQDRLNSLATIFNLGWNVEANYSAENEIVKVAPKEYFYADVLLAEFSDLEQDSYNESFLDWFNYNSIRAGYEKFAGDDEIEGTISDAFTETFFSSPVKSLSGVTGDTSGPVIKSFLSKYIASDVLLEVTRRKQFSEKPTESFKYDEDLFLLEVTDEYDSPFKQGSRYNITQTFTDYAGLPEFNLTITPRFNFFNWFSFLNSQLYKKTLESTYLNTQYLVNPDQKIFYTDSVEPPILGDTTVYTEGTAPSVSDDIQAIEMTGGQRLFDPVKISFRVAMSRQQVDFIIDGHRNALGTRNYGFIRVTNPDGEIIDGWLLTVSYNIVDEIGSFEIIRKADNYEIS